MHDPERSGDGPHGGSAPVALEPLESLETYRSQVFFRGGEAWKIKKPVRAGLLDYSTLEARRSACEAELRLNRRFAPDVYGGLVPVTLGRSGERQLGGDGEPVDWAIHMRRLADAHRINQRLASGRLGNDEIRQIAHRLAALHHEAHRDALTAEHASPRALRALIELRIEALPSQAEPQHPPTELPAEARQAEAWQLRFLEDHAELFEARAAAGHAREGHGALSLERIFVGDAGNVDFLDCVEFDDRLRHGDVCADVAFLASNLAVEGRADFAERLLAEYAFTANDFDLYPLVDFFSSLRASLRGKTEWFYADAFRGDPKGAEERRARARRAFLLALAAPRRALLPPAVIAMGGQVASGKSTIAAAMAWHIGAPYVSADETRAFLLGATPVKAAHEIHWELAYEPGFGPRVYAELLRRAEAVLRSGRPVVVDGCFRSPAQREQVRALARRFGHPFLFVEAQVPVALQRERLRERAARDGVEEQVWFEIADDLRADWEPARELPPEECAQLDTSKPLEDSVRELRSRLATWPDELTG